MIFRRERREILIRSGPAIVRARLLATPSANRIWQTLPIYSTAELWGAAIHFETHADTGREADARAVIQRGEIAYWSEEDRIIIPFGPTPLSRPGELRLPVPSNVWARALDDVAVFAHVQPGRRVAVLIAES